MFFGFVTEDLILRSNHSSILAFGDEADTRTSVTARLTIPTPSGAER